LSHCITDLKRSKFKVKNAKMPKSYFGRDSVANYPIYLNLKSSIIKKYYKTIYGKEAQSLYKSPVITKMKRKFF